MNAASLLSIKFMSSLWILRLWERIVGLWCDVISLDFRIAWSLACTWFWFFDFSTAFLTSWRYIKRFDQVYFFWVQLRSSARCLLLHKLHGPSSDISHYLPCCMNTNINLSDDDDDVFFPSVVAITLSCLVIRLWCLYWVY